MWQALFIRLDRREKTKRGIERKRKIGQSIFHVPMQDDGLIKDWILADTGGIAYFGYAYYKQNTAVRFATHGASS